VQAVKQGAIPPLVMEKLMRLGLVIQGPTRSSGLTPLGWAARADGIPVESRPPHVIDYGVWPELRLMLSEHGARFERMVQIASARVPFILIYFSAQRCRPQRTWVGTQRRRWAARHFL
jgi:hypothetical protein